MNLKLNITGWQLDLPVPITYLSNLEITLETEDTLQLRYTFSIEITPREIAHAATRLETAIRQLDGISYQLHSSYVRGQTWYILTFTKKTLTV
jgi:hypothetical protein